MLLEGVHGGGEHVYVSGGCIVASEVFMSSSVTVHALLGDTSQIFKKRANFPSPLTRPGYLRLSFQLLCLPFVYGDTDVYLRHKKVWARVFFIFFSFIGCVAWHAGS